MSEKDKYMSNAASVALTAGIASLIGSGGWTNPEYKYRSFVKIVHHPSKAKKRSRKAQRLARKRNRS